MGFACLIYCRHYIVFDEVLPQVVYDFPMRIGQFRRHFHFYSFPKSELFIPFGWVHEESSDINGVFLFVFA